MQINVKTPTKAYVEGTPEEIKDLAKFLSYTNTSSAFQYKKHMKNRWWRQKDPDGWKSRAEELKASMHSCLLFQDEGKICLRPGSIPHVEDEFSQVTVTKDPSYLKMFQKPKPFPWYNKLSFELYDYQKLSVQELLAILHGNVQLCTGAGKTAILLCIAQKLGLKTLIAVPSVSIFDEVLKKFEYHFGKSAVGALGDGKKRFGKLFTVAISKSLTNLKPGTPEFKEIASAQVLLVDESHLWGAESLDSVCHNLAANIPYRFFFSGTQTRGDGTKKLLQSIIGKTVVTLTTEEAIKGGYICDHEFRIVSVKTTSPGYSSDDALAMKRKHLLHNDNIAKFIANLANSVYKAKGEQVLVLVDEIDQIYRLIPHLEIPYVCATGENRKDLGDTDPIDAVEKFNKGEAKLLVGTSCISTGTNIFPTHHTVNWQGGTSEIKTKQGAVGRTVRLLKGSKYEKYHVPKEKALIWDFDVIAVDIMKKHLAERISYYNDSGTQIKAIG